MAFGGYSSNGGFNSTHGIDGRGSNRKVFTTDQTIHVWAAQSQDEGRNAKGSVFFRGPTVYSYGSHFPLGHFMPAGVVLLNADSHSVTTSGHQSSTRYAVNHKTTYSVPRLARLIQDGYGPLNLLLSVHSKARGKADLLAYLSDHAATMADDSLAYLAGLIGKSGPKLKAAAIKAAERKAKADAKSKLELDLYNAAKAVALTGPGLIARTKARDSWNYAGDIGNALKEARRLHRVASQAGKAKLKAGMWAIVKDLQTEHGLATRLSDIKSRNKYIKGQIAQIRHDLALLDRGELDSAWRLVMALESRTLRVSLATAANLDLLAKAVRADARRIEATGKANRAVRQAREAREAAERRAREEQARIEREAAKRAAWFNGEAVSWTGRDEAGRAYLRARGDRLETSQGASVPLSEAVKVFRMVKLCRAKGVAWRCNGETLPVGSFQVDRIEANGDFRAGCHAFAWSEVERLAVALGLAELPASDEGVEHARA